MSFFSVFFDSATAPGLRRLHPTETLKTTYGAASSLGLEAKKSVMVLIGMRNVAAQHVRVANRQLSPLEAYIVESADFVAVA
ncbi:hypothetical protein B9K09_02290 [Pseudomonas sp. M30-35]|nr:hypothetical protein B9K09_02290 [Pseudomonas sp. M30-35]